MMKSNRAGPELGFSREPASAVADAIVAGIEANAFEVIRGGEARAQMIALNRNDPVAVDARFLTLKSALEEAVRTTAHCDDAASSTASTHEANHEPIQERSWRAPEV